MCTMIPDDESMYVDPVVVAINDEDPDMLMEALDNTVDINRDIGDGWTYLHEAFDLAIDGMIQCGTERPDAEILRIISLLISKGADPVRYNNKWKRPIDAINTYSGSQQNFDLLMSFFRDIVPRLDDLISFQPRTS